MACFYRCSPKMRRTYNTSSNALASLRSGTEALGEPAVDFGEHRTCFVATALFCEQPREAHRRAQFPPSRFLPLRDFDRFPQARFAFATARTRPLFATGAQRIRRYPLRSKPIGSILRSPPVSWNLS